MPLHLRSAATLLAALLVAVAGTAIVAERLSVRAVREQVEHQLLASRDRAAVALETHVNGTRAALAALAADPRTVAAFRRLRRATDELDTDAATDVHSIGPHRTAVRSYLRRYYAAELRRRALQLDSLLVPHPAAIWLQSTFLGAQQKEPDTSGSSVRRPVSRSLYETENEIWQPIFEDLVRRHGWQDLLLADAGDGRIVYSVSKTPVFQTSLLDGPYSESSLGSLYRELRGVAQGRAKWSDFAPFVPAHGQPVCYVGAPIFDGGSRIGVLLVEEDRDRLGRVVSADGRWSTIGLGATGDLFVVGADSRMRSRPRFFDELRAMHPAVDRRGTTVLALDVESIPEVSETTKPVYYVNHRQVPVLGAVRDLEIPEVSWVVVAEMEEAEGFAPVGRLREILGLVVIGALLLAAVVFLAVVKRMRRPTTQILDTLRAVRDGDSTARVPPGSIDEAGALGEAVNDLLDAHAGWLRQESAERQQRETEIHEIVSVLKGLARGDLSQRARVDGHLAALANAVNAMGVSVGRLTDRLCVLPPRIAETAYAMQASADQILRDAGRQIEDLGAVGTVAGEMLDWLHGCTVDASGVVDAASRVEQIGRGMKGDNAAKATVAETAEGNGAPGQARAEHRTSDQLPPVAARYQRLRATIDQGEKLRATARNAVDVARRIRAAAEALRGHVQTLQVVALDLHAQGAATQVANPNGGRRSDAQQDDSAG